MHPRIVYDEKSKEAAVRLFLLDALLTVLVFLGTFALRERWFAHNPADFEAHLALLPVLLAVQAYLLWAGGVYRRLRIASLFHYFWTVLRAVLIAVVAVLVLVFFVKATYVSRSFLLMFAFFDVVVLVAVRLALIAWYFARPAVLPDAPMRVLVVGTGERAARLVELLRRNVEWGLEVVGFLDVASARPAQPAVRGRILGTVGDIAEVLKANVVDEVIVAVPRSLLDEAQAIAEACEEEGVRLRFMADVFELQVSRLRLVELGGVPLLTFEPVAQDEALLLAKRLFDLTLTLLAMPLVLPLMALIAVLIKLDSPGPVFFVQERVGLHKRTFRMYKFRSMYVDAEARMKELEHLNEAEGPIFKIRNDPRVTRLGRLLRRTSLDELPQLFNVLKGDMSLVGPRPMSLRDVNLFDRGIQRKRFSVKPGLTCLWQISGRSNLPFSRWLELDLEYIERWSLWLDLKILLKTIPAVLRGSGAV
jgi:exopolysaccharide biosynthesis polyprenyl glycosylphosphotransferase